MASAGQFVKDLIDIGNSPLSQADQMKLKEQHIEEVFKFAFAEGKLAEFLTSTTKNGYPVIFAIERNAGASGLNYLAKAIKQAEALDPDVFNKILLIKYKDRNLMETLGAKKSAELLAKLTGQPVQSPIAKPEQPSELVVDKNDEISEQPVDMPKSGRSGKASILLSKDGRYYKFLPSPAEKRKIQAGLTHSSINLEDFQEFISHLVGQGKLDLPDKLSVRLGQKALEKSIEQAKKVLGDYSRQNPTGLTPREKRFLVRLQRYCFVAPNGLIFSIKKYKYLQSKRNFVQIIKDLFGKGEEFED